MNVKLTFSLLVDGPVYWVLKFTINIATSMFYTLTVPLNVRLFTPLFSSQDTQFQDDIRCRCPPTGSQSVSMPGRNLK